MVTWPLGRLALLTVLAGLAAAGILALAGRGAPDPAERRADAVYLFTVRAVTLFLALFSAVGAVRGALALALPGTAVWAVTIGSSAELGAADHWTDIPPWAPGAPSRAVAYGPSTAVPDPLPRAIAFAVLATAAGLAYRWHERRARGLIAEPGFAGSAASRVHRAYLALVSAAALLVLIFASAEAVLGLVGAIVAGGFGPGPRVGLLRSVSAGLLAAGAFLIFRSHRAGRGGATAAGPTP